MEGRWRLPGPSTLVAEIVESLGGGRSVVLLCPERPDLRSLEQVLSRLVYRRWHHVELAEVRARPGSVAQQLHDHLCLPGHPGDAEMAHVVGAEELVDSALWLAPSGASDARALASLITTFTRAAARREGASRPVLFCAARMSDLEPLPVSEAALLRLWWWARLGPLDTKTVVDAAMGPARVIGDLDVVSEVATFDLTLAEDLARRYTGGLAQDLAPLLVDGLFDAFAETPTVAQSLGDLLLDEPPEAIRDAWSAGTTDWWGDRIAVHAGCLLQHAPSELRRLEWRGQVGTVLPFVEQSRQRLARWVLDRRHLLERGWSEKDIMELDAGPLHRLFRDNPKLRGTRMAWQMADVVKDARHALAHLEPLDRDWLRRHESMLRATTL